jgi:hypothetical protein
MKYRIIHEILLSQKVDHMRISLYLLNTEDKTYQASRYYLDVKVSDFMLLIEGVLDNFLSTCDFIYPDTRDRVPDYSDIVQSIYKVYKENKHVFKSNKQRI